MKKPLHRRTLLRGALGVGVALPFLDAMRPRAHAATAGPPPNRFVAMWGGISYGSGRTENYVVPTTTGTGYTPTRALAPLDAEAVKSRVTVFSNLVLPWETGGTMPPGGRSVFFHYNTMGPLFSGVAGLPNVRDGKPRGPTCDQVVADAIAGNTAFRVLAYRVQPASYVGTNSIGGNSGALSWRRNSTGALVRVDPTVSPRIAYENLFTGFTPTDPAEAAMARAALRRRTSVLDLVREDMSRVVGEVGSADRQRLDQHFTHIRELEERVKATPVAEGACKVLRNPGADPAIGGAIIEYNGNGMSYSTANGYSNEDARADLMSDLITMAFACDRSRVASFMITEWKCYMNMFQLYGWKSDMHECTHGADGTSSATADAIGFHVKQFARLVRKLGATPDVDGKTLLDRSAVVLMFEGGKGFDPEGGKDNSAHSTEGMIALLAGGAGGMTHGRHVRTAALHPATVFVTAMKAVGAGDALGQITKSAL